MPAKTNAWFEVLGCSCQCLAVVTQSEIKSQIRTYVNAVLGEAGYQPLAQFVGTDAKVNWLRVILYVVECQLIERRRCCVLECECAQDCSSGFATKAPRRVMNHATAKTEIVHSV